MGMKYLMDAHVLRWLVGSPDLVISSTDRARNHQGR